MNERKSLVNAIAVVVFIFCLGFVFTLGSAATMGSMKAPEPKGEKAAAKAAGAKAKTLVVVHLREPDFAIWEMKYRVFYNKSEIKHLPLTDYDFKVAFSDELVNALAADKRAEWVLASDKEKIDVIAIYDKKTNPPASLEADRILLVDVHQYGALVADLGPDKFYLMARMKLIDKTGRQKLWAKKWYERIPLPAKVAELQADNQKGLKEGINKLIEQIAQKVVVEIKKASY